MEQHEEGNKIDLMKYRLETAKSDLRTAKMLIEAEEYRASNNRAYYAIFHAISAIHALDEKSYKRHKDTISNFNKDYVKTEIFPREMGKKISQAEEIRHESDYDDFYIATREKSQEQIETAEELIELVENFCKSRIDKVEKYEIN
ncbi:MAG: HEPN domain-containing protein [Roseburia sp.]|nr:HEPN domain-containing protein [Ruminococcus sp.]MCM1153981.1 HEPN domain-containing protein [Roseburia sp.]MCM1242283.1 HEPN domain-containing protein [Roseburia sp.]